MGGDSIYFLANEKWWRPIFYMIAVWKDIGWGTIIYIAALSGVDMEQHEAAVLDGATRFQRVIYLTLPAISGTIVTVFILNLAKVLNLFDPVWVLQNSMVVNTFGRFGNLCLPHGHFRFAVRSVHGSRLVQIRHFYPAGCHRQ